MKNILTTVLLSTALLTTVATAYDGKLVPVDFDFAADDTNRAKALVVYNPEIAQKAQVAVEEKEAPSKSWWNSLKDGGYNLGAGLVDLGYGVANLGYSTGMIVKGAGEAAFGTAEYIYGAAHNTYGTLRGYEADFMENGTSWSNAGWDKMAYGANDIKDGICNIPNTATHFMNGVPKVLNGGLEFADGASRGISAVEQYLP